MRLSFRFKKIDLGNFTIRRPIIQIYLISGEHHVKAEALIDSGSDGIVLPKELAEILGLTLGTKTTEIGLGGEKLKVVFAHLNLKLTDGRHTARMFGYPAYVPIEGGVNLQEIILGTEPFFRDFNITFKQNSNRILLERARRA